MRISQACESYFNVFREISCVFTNDAKTNILAIAKFLSLFTIICPLGFALAYALAGRCKRSEGDSKTKQVFKKAVKGDEEDIEELCKIAKQQLLTEPKVVPNELTRALHLQEAERRSVSGQDESYLLPLQAKKFCLLAEGYHLAGDSAKAGQLIESATYA